MVLRIQSLEDRECLQTAVSRHQVLTLLMFTAILQGALAGQPARWQGGGRGQGYREAALDI